jgi:hypothetical protein
VKPEEQNSFVTEGGGVGLEFVGLKGAYQPVTWERIRKKFQYLDKLLGHFRDQAEIGPEFLGWHGEM